MYECNDCFRDFALDEGTASGSAFHCDDCSIARQVATAIDEDNEREDFEYLGNSRFAREMEQSADPTLEPKQYWCLNSRGNVDVYREV